MFNTVAGLYTLWQLRQREQGINRKEGEGMAESKKLQRYAAMLLTRHGLGEAKD